MQWLPTSPRQTARLHVLVLLWAGLAAYANSLSGPFIFDDIGSIPDNPYIRTLWPPWHCLKAPGQETVAGRPVVSLTLAINYAIGGYNVTGYHVFNLLLHLINGLLLYALVRRTILTSPATTHLRLHAGGFSLVVALVWLVHPLHTESVTYVIQRTELMMGLFLLLTLYSLARASGAEPSVRWRWGVMAVVSCAMGMGSKQVMVVAPILAVLYDRIFLSGSLREVVRDRGWVHAGIMGTWGILGLILWSMPTIHSVGTHHISSWQYLLTQSGVIVEYVKLFFWPAELVLDYDDWPVATTIGEVWVTGTIVCAMLGATAWAMWRQPVLGFLGAWFFLILAPTSSVMPIVTEIAAERRMYMPSVALVVLVVAIGYRFRIYFQSRHRLLTRIVGFIICAAWIMALGVRTHARNFDYQSELSIWGKTVQQRPASVRARVNYGFSYANLGDDDAAMEQYQVALQLDPRHWATHLKIAAVMNRRRDKRRAIEHYQLAIMHHAGSAISHMNLAVIYQGLGQDQAALFHIQQAVQFAPHDVEAQYNAGWLWEKHGDRSRAIFHYRQAIGLNRHHAQTHFNLANVLVEEGRLDEAQHHYRETIRIHPEHLKARLNLGNIHLEKGRVQEAVEQFEVVLRLYPGMMDARHNLAVAFGMQRRFDEALREINRLLQRSASDPELLELYAGTLANAGKAEEAVRQFTEAANRYREMNRPAAAERCQRQAERLKRGK